MRDLDNTTTTTTGGATTPAALSAPSLREIAEFTSRLALTPLGEDDADADAGRIDRLTALETLRCATESALLETTADFVTSGRQHAADRGVPAARRDQGLAAQIALARRTSPTRGRQQLGLAMLLRRGELAHTRAAFREGRIDGYQVSLIAKETLWLTAEHRAQVDEALCADPDGTGTVIEGLSLPALHGRLARYAAELDPAAVAERRRHAEADRHTSLRPAPDTMTWHTALLTVKDGVAVHATLDRDARTLRAGGDPRTLGQLRADLLVQRVLHPRPDAIGSPVPVMVNMIVRDTVLLGEAEGTGWVEGYGPVPGDLIREWVADNLEDTDAGDVTAWLRRLYETPQTGELITMDSTARFFPPKIATFLRLRDRRCRTPYCGARIRHCDHVIDNAKGGPTNTTHGQGLCEPCNHAKATHGWTARPRPGPRHTIETTTPTGHTYTSEAERF